jgi:hypothetical protein
VLLWSWPSAAAGRKPPPTRLESYLHASLNQPYFGRSVRNLILSIPSADLASNENTCRVRPVSPLSRKPFLPNLTDSYLKRPATVTRRHWAAERLYNTHEHYQFYRASRPKIAASTAHISRPDVEEEAEQPSARCTSVVYATSGDTIWRNSDRRRWGIGCISTSIHSGEKQASGNAPACRCEAQRAPESISVSVAISLCALPGDVMRLLL